jgi:hypothetical protein
LPDDATQLLEKCLKTSGRSAHVFCGSIVASEKYIEHCVKPFEKLMEKKAEKVIFTTYFKYFSSFSGIEILRSVTAKVILNTIHHSSAKHAYYVSHVFQCPSLSIQDAVTSPALLAELSKKDLHDLETKSSKQDKKEERRAKAASGGGSKGGGGRGAREVKTKKVLF